MLYSPAGTIFLSRPRLALQDSTLRQATVTTSDYTETIGHCLIPKYGSFLQVSSISMGKKIGKTDGIIH